MFFGGCQSGLKLNLVTFPGLFILSALLISGCASQHDVEQVEFRVSDHQDEIGDIKSEISVLEKRRIELHDQVIALKLNGSANSSDVEKVVNELNHLDKRYLQLNSQLNKVAISASKNDEAIKQLQSKEERRQEIIRRHNDRWATIDASTDRKIAALDEPDDSELVVEENKTEVMTKKMRREEIIRRHNERWENINASTDRKISALEEPAESRLVVREIEE